DTARIASFVAVPATRSDALDALAAREDGAEALVAIDSGADVDVALALAHPSGSTRASWLARAPSAVLRAFAGLAPASDWAFDAARDEATRRRSAQCLALVRDGAEVAATALATERDPAGVSWLALAARDRPIAPGAWSSLFDRGSTRIAAITIAPATRRAAS